MFGFTIYVVHTDKTSTFLSNNKSSYYYYSQQKKSDCWSLSRWRWETFQTSREHSFQGRPVASNRFDHLHGHKEKKKFLVLFFCMLMEAVIIERGSTMKQMVTWSISLTEPFPAPCRGSRCTRLSDEVNNPSGRFWVSSPLRVDQKASLNKGTVIFSFSRANFLFVFLQIYRQSLQ